MRVVMQFTMAVVVLATCSAASAQSVMPWQANLETAQRMAAQTNRLVLIHFWAPWCRPCMRLEQEVFSNPETAKGLEANFVLVKLNADEAPGTARLYGVSSLPTDVITTPSGRLVSQIQSPPSASQYVTQMNNAAAGHRALARKPGEASAAAPIVPSATEPDSPLAPQSPPRDPYGTGAGSIASMPPSTSQSSTPGERYAEYFPENHAPPAENGPPVMPAQAYSAAPGSSGHTVVDPYAQPAAEHFAASQAPTPAPYNAESASPAPYAANPYEQGRYGNSAPPPAPVAEPYAGSVPNTPPTAPPQSHAPVPSYVSQASVAPQPQLPQIPAGCPPLALDGNCPVTLVERKRWAVGHPTFGAVHRGRTYLFLGPQEREKFLADPDRFSPVMAGLDPVMAIDNRSSVPGKREFGVFGADGRIYLFADESSRARFEQNEQHYTGAVAAAMQQPPTYQAMRPTP